MTSKILASAAALALATTAGLATTAPASARHMHAHWNPGYVAADIAGGVIGGALATATMPFWGTGYGGYPGSYYPGYAYSPDYAYGPGYTYAPEYSYGYRPYGRYHGYRGYRGYYGYGGRGRCFQTCPHRYG
jgi:hypothetical protein